MQKITPTDFTTTRAWGAQDVMRFHGETTVRLHWTDAPYRWHVNDGPEVFVVLDGAVEMLCGDPDAPEVHVLNAGDIFCADPGDAHVAHPRGVARVLVIERAGSV